MDRASYPDPCAERVFNRPRLLIDMPTVSPSFNIGTTSSRTVLISRILVRIGLSRKFYQPAAGILLAHSAFSLLDGSR